MALIACGKIDNTISGELVGSNTYSTGSHSDSATYTTTKSYKKIIVALSASAPYNESINATASFTGASIVSRQSSTGDSDRYSCLLSMYEGDDIPSGTVISLTFLSYRGGYIIYGIE